MVVEPRAAAHTVGSGRALQAAREHRPALLRAIRNFEQAVAAPARDPAWRDQVARRLGALRIALTEHIVVTEGPEGLYHELLGHAPRLSRGVSVLIAEHAALLVTLDALRRRLLDGTGIEVLRDAADELLADLSSHRQRGADLIYEAYAFDLGGET